MSAAPAPSRRPPLPGGLLRVALRRALPKPIKREIKRRMLGTRWFPRPPARAATLAPAPRPAGPPPMRRLEVSLPAPPGGGRAPGPLAITCPPYMYIPRKLDEAGLGAYEPHALDCFLTLVERAGPGAVYDVGANVGIYGLLAAAYSDRTVHCFEPAPDTAQAARDIAAASGLHLEVAEIALGDSTGSATLYLSDSTDSSNSLNPDFRAHSKEIVVPLETLDDYVARTGAVPALIKIDTETTEPEVLNGARKVIAEHRPWLMVEVLWSLVEDRLHAVMDQFGYTYYHLNGPGPRPATQQIVGDSTWTHYMFLLAPEPVGDEFWRRMDGWREVLNGSTIRRG
ncbi:MAG TPA: FkbM family methyltransferase [Kineosporiaceae bacterium]